MLLEPLKTQAVQYIDFLWHVELVCDRTHTSHLVNVSNESFQGDNCAAMLYPFVYPWPLTTRNKILSLSFCCMKPFVTLSAKLIFLEFVHWKRTNGSGIYRLIKRIQFLNTCRQKSKGVTITAFSSASCLLLSNVSWRCIQFSWGWLEIPLLLVFRVMSLLHLGRHL